MVKVMTTFQKGQLAAYKIAGMSSSCIASKLGFNKCTINRVYKRVKAGKLTRLKGSGRPRKTTTRTDRIIVREVVANRLITAPEIREFLPTLIGGKHSAPSICDTTIRRRIKESGKFKSYWAAKKPFISVINKKKRVQWGLAHRHWTKEQWRKVMWTDESPFVLRFNRKRRVWRLHNERYAPKRTVGTVKHDKKIMVWGCFVAHGVGHLHRVDGIMDQKQYKQILVHHMKPSLKQLFPTGDGTFQQDNDPKHSAKSVTRYLNNPANRIPQLHIIGNHVKPLRWPAQSPDLNPIENLWSILDLSAKNRNANNEEELMNTLREAWNNIPVDTLEKLADSMPKRIEEMLKNKGHATSY